VILLESLRDTPASRVCKAPGILFLAVGRCGEASLSARVEGGGAKGRRLGGNALPLRLLQFVVVRTLKFRLGGFELWLQADSLIVIVIAFVGCHDCILFN
jgi:hypothetical protein